MMMKKVSIAAAVALLSVTHAPAFAQAKAPAAPALTEAQQTHAVQDFAILASAMRSDKVGDDVKSALMGCIYSNPLGKISTAIDKVSLDNPGKVDRKNADSVLGAMAAVCGYQPATTAAAPSAPAPKPQQGAPAGR